MNANSLTFNELGLESLDRETVQSRSAVEENRMTTGDLFENVPDLSGLTFDHFLGRTNSVDVAELFEAADDERLEQNQCHLLGQTALMQFEFGTDDDDRAAGVIDAFAEQVL